MLQLTRCMYPLIAMHAVSWLYQNFTSLSQLADNLGRGLSGANNIVAVKVYSNSMKTLDSLRVLINGDMCADSD